MAKNTKTPGNALGALLKKHNLNYNRLARAIGMSSAMVRLIALDENPVSAAVAFRLARFFKQKPDFWLSLQTEYDLARTAADKKLARELKDIPTVDKAIFERGKKSQAFEDGKNQKNNRRLKGQSGAEKNDGKSKENRNTKGSAKNRRREKTGGKESRAQTRRGKTCRGKTRSGCETGGDAAARAATGRAATGGDADSGPFRHAGRRAKIIKALAGNINFFLHVMFSETSLT